MINVLSVKGLHYTDIIIQNSTAITFINKTRKTIYFLNLFLKQRRTIIYAQHESLHQNIHLRMCVQHYTTQRKHYDITCVLEVLLTHHKLLMLHYLTAQTQAMFPLQLQLYTE